MLLAADFKAASAPCGGISLRPYCATIGAAFIQEGREIAERRRRGTSLKSPAREMPSRPSLRQVAARQLIDRRPP